MLFEAPSHGSTVGSISPALQQMAPSGDGHRGPFDGLRVRAAVIRAEDNSPSSADPGIEGLLALLDHFGALIRRYLVDRQLAFGCAFRGKAEQPV